MKLTYICMAIATCLSLSGCVSIPKETIALSQMISNDLVAYKASHVELAERYFDKIEDDVNKFVDKKIAPALINEIVKLDIEDFEQNPKSLFATLYRAKENLFTDNTTELVEVISDFQLAINEEIGACRAELLNPVREQRKKILANIISSYDATIEANASLTSYIASASKVKEKQNDILSYVGMEGFNDSIMANLASLSLKINQLSNNANDLSSSQLVNSLSSLLDKTFTKK